MKRIAGSLDANVLLRLLLNDMLDQHKAALKLVENDLVEFNVADSHYRNCFCLGKTLSIFS